MNKLCFFVVKKEITKFPILSIHQFDENGKEHELYVNTFTGHLKKHQAHISLPHKHDFYLSVLFTQGTGFHEVDFNRYDVRPGTVFFLQPGQTHYWEFSDDVEGIIFFHSPDYFHLNFPHQPLANFPFFFSRQNKPFLQLPETLITAVKDQYEGLLTEFRSSLPYRYQKIGSLLNCLYIDLRREYEQEYGRQLGDSQRYSEKFRAFETVIEDHFRTEKSAQFYADALHITTKHLNRVSRESAGKTSTEVILERVMLEAKRLLSEGGMNLNEIALQLGYEEYAYFSRLFRRSSGESPREFAKHYH
jgi:AraC family transcriptional activator of pobA